MAEIKKAGSAMEGALPATYLLIMWLNYITNSDLSTEDKP